MVQEKEEAWSYLPRTTPPNIDTKSWRLLPFNDILVFLSLRIDRIHSVNKASIKLPSLFGCFCFTFIFIEFNTK